jgi:hypothetical protein
VWMADNRDRLSSRGVAADRIIVARSVGVAGDEQIEVTVAVHVPPKRSSRSSGLCDAAAARASAAATPKAQAGILMPASATSANWPPRFRNRVLLGASPDGESVPRDGSNEAPWQQKRSGQPSGFPCMSAFCAQRKAGACWFARREEGGCVSVFSSFRHPAKCLTSTLDKLYYGNPLPPPSGRRAGANRTYNYRKPLLAASSFHCFWRPSFSLSHWLKYASKCFVSAFYRIGSELSVFCGARR